MSHRCLPPPHSITPSPPPSHTFTLCPFSVVAGRDEAGGRGSPVGQGGALLLGLHWMLLPLLVLPLASVPLVSEDRALLRELRLASEGRASRRGGILSLMRSRPLASSKLVILCWGEKPLIAVEMQEIRVGRGGGGRELGVILYGVEFKWLKEWGWKGWGSRSHSPVNHQIWLYLLCSWNCERKKIVLLRKWQQRLHLITWWAAG